MALAVVLQSELGITARHRPRYQYQPWSCFEVFMDGWLNSPTGYQWMSPVTVRRCLLLRFTVDSLLLGTIDFFLHAYTVPTIWYQNTPPDAVQIWKNDLYRSAAVPTNIDFKKDFLPPDTACHNQANRRMNAMSKRSGLPYRLIHYFSLGFMYMPSLYQNPMPMDWVFTVQR